MFQIKRAASLVTAVVAVASLTACVSNPYQQSSYPSQQQQPTYSQGGNQQNTNQSVYGTITNVQLVRGQGGSGLTGAVVGGAVGGLAGNQVGGGSGRAVATVAGLAAGALIGRAIEQNTTRTQGRDYYRVTVQLDGGQMHSLDYADTPNVRIGDRVRLQGNQLYR